MQINLVSIISRMNVGGPAVLLSEFINSLPENDFSHTLITGHCQDNEIDYLNLHPINSKVIYINNFKKSQFFIADIRSLIRIMKILKANKPDIVHTHTSKAGFLGRISCRLVSKNTKIVHTYHGHLLYGYFPNWRTKIIVTLERFLGRFTDVYIAVSRQIKEDLIRVGIGPRNKWEIIHPGVSLPSDWINRRTLNPHTSSSDIFTIAWIGRFTDIKNPLLAVKSLEIISNSRNVRMLMAGDGELVDQCYKYIKDKNLPIELLGWVSDINPVLAQADLLLVSSKNEGMPVVIIEAALRGIPIISTRVGGVVDFISHGLTGYLVDQDSASLAKGLSFLIDSNNLLKDIAINAENLAKSEFSLEKFTNSHVNLYLSLFKK